MIDLGDRQLRVIDTPGHSPDGICLFDERHGVLFAGDTLMEGALYAHYDESSLPDLLASVGKLAALSAPVSAICAGHIPRAVAETTLIAETAAAVQRVLDGGPIHVRARRVRLCGTGDARRPRVDLSFGRRGEFVPAA